MTTNQMETLARSQSTSKTRISPMLRTNAVRQDIERSLPAENTTDRTNLTRAWLQEYGAPPPKSLSQPLMARILAFDAQVKTQGGLDRKTAKRLKAQGPMTDGKPRPKAPTPSPGTKLLREWNGVTHCVEVTETGFLWDGTPYRSLSAIARAITGAHWSGPRFFGTQGKVDG